MKVVISADMEGTCGVVSWMHVTPPEYPGKGEPINQSEYNRARGWMTAEVNAAVAGAMDAGAEEVIVCDSHDGARNLIPEELDPRCRFVTGGEKPLSMAQGVDLPGVGAFMYTGYHARAGTPLAPLAHTWTRTLNDIRLNGDSIGEFGINAIVAGHFGVPVVMISGDEKAVAQTKALLGEQVVGVVVKEGLSTTAAIHLHPEVARQRIRDGARLAVERIGDARVFALPEGATIELDYDHQSRADQVAKLTEFTRVGERTVAYQPADGLEFLRLFKNAMEVAGITLSP
ncbi:MAG: M55 family metallopeptidase [Thermomicrobiales bacterium]|nr:M55 family metallopeptidase [Thermomicrobiales bacterium]